MNNENMYRIIDDFLDNYHCGINSIYQHKDKLKSKNLGSFYDAMVDLIAASFENVLYSGSSLDRFLGKDDIKTRVIRDLGI